MLNFKQFYLDRLQFEQTVESEIQTYAIDESFFDEIISEADGGNYNPNNPWHKLKRGASEYFGATPERQKEIHAEAKGIESKKMMTPESANPKLAKNGEKMPDHDTKALFLAPSTMSGVDVCPAASKECKAACLGKEAGRAHMRPTKDAKIWRTKLMFDHPTHFYAKLDQEITSAKTAAQKKGKQLAVRLNGTSDIPHEQLAPQLFEKHKDVKFYDYTKIAGRTKSTKTPSNYHLTMSSTGINHEDSNWKDVRKHLDKGGVASMVFKVQTSARNRPAGGLPTHVHDEETGKKYRVVDGDEHDHRHLDHKYNNVPKSEGIIAGLRMKGGAKNVERAGKFAVDVDKASNTATVRKGEN